MDAHDGEPHPFLALAVADDAERHPNSEIPVVVVEEIAAMWGLLKLAGLPREMRGER